VDSLGGEDITLSPGELGGSQYIMSPGDRAREHAVAEREHGVGRQSALPSSVEEVAALELRQQQRLYPIFVKGRKIVHLVRHGQSTYNEAISGPGSWDEPNIFDAPLTTLGVNQARGLGGFLAKLPKDAVWVTSALTRRDGDVRARVQVLARGEIRAEEKSRGGERSRGRNRVREHRRAPAARGKEQEPSLPRRERVPRRRRRSSDENGYADDGGSEDAVPTGGDDARRLDADAWRMRMRTRERAAAERSRGCSRTRRRPRRWRRSER
jgi:hypothetical protein